jgi:hypothetical protein
MTTLIVVYVMFFAGYTLHMMLQVDAIVRAKNNAAYSRTSVLKQNAFVLSARLFISFLVFWFIRNNPQFLTTLLSYIGITLSPGIGDAISASSWGVAGMFGYIVDSVLAFIPFLKNYVPQLNSDVTVSIATTTQPGAQPKTITTVSETHTETKA